MNAPHPPPVRRRHRITGWLSRRRGVAADQFLRGLCYGAGTAVVSLVVLWAHHRW